MKLKVYHTSCLVVFFLLLLAAAAGGQTPGSHTIRLKGGAVTAAGNAQRWLDSTAQHPPAGPAQVLLHFSSLPTPGQRAALAGAGVTLMGYVPDNTYTAIVRFPLDQNKLRETPLHSIVPVAAEMKADGYLWQKAAAQKGVVEVLVSFHAGIAAESIRQYVASVGGRIVQGQWDKFHAYHVVVAASRLHALAGWYGVQYISPVAAPTALDNQSMPPIKADLAAGPRAMGDAGLTGDGVTVGVGDDGAGIYHIDLRGRITDFNPVGASLHGQLTNGIVGSAAIIDPFAVTMTPHVSIVDHYFDNLLGATGDMYNDYNMTIGNNSYALIVDDCGYSGTYDGYSRFVDTLALMYPYAQHVFAAGNDGLLQCGAYPVGFATIEGGYQPAKNAISVGSMTDFLVKAIDECRGPTKDGRLKPEVISVGLGSYSCQPGNGYLWTAGTSMAAPQVTGALAALTQQYKAVIGAQPRTDVLKAILLGGAKDLGNPGPDYSYGYGAVDMLHSLQMISSRFFDTNTVANGGSQTFTITVPPNTAQVKVLLYWNDVPGNPMAATELVNDLDLTVTDPSSAVHLPLVLDPSPANVNNNAVPGADHLNNSEQVVINTPAAGTYTVTVKGYNVPEGPQPYAVAYDFVPAAFGITSPLGGEQYPNNTGDSIRFFWDGVNNGDVYTGQFSTDNGATWVTVSDSIPSSAAYFGILLMGVNSGECLMRLTDNNTGQTATSGKFVVNNAPVITLDTAQCPSYVNIHWSPVPNATGYYLLKKAGLYMQVVDSVTGIYDTAYSFGGMPVADTSYVAVQPILSGLAGYRSLAARALAATGNCSKPVSNGDLMMVNGHAPGNGRQNTSTAIIAGDPVRVTVRNLYSSPCAGFTIAYEVNGGPWQQWVNPGVIPANDTASFNITGVPLGATGTYQITVAVTNTTLADPQPANDTIAFTILNIPNAPVDLSTAFFDGFETMSIVSVSHDSVGVSPNGHWDFFEVNDTGRMRSFVADGITITGSRSISLDEMQCTANGSKNRFAGTFNLSGYDTSTAEIRIDFDYILHGNPKTDSGNIVTARGNDTSVWAPLAAYNLTAYPGYVTHVASQSLTDALRSERRNFSSSTQVCFGQNDTSLIALVNYGNGITIDNFKMYTVTNDAELISVVSPLASNCGLPAASPLVVAVRNGVQATLHNVQMFYSLDGGTTYTGVIDSILPKTIDTFTFTQLLNLPPGTTHTLNIWLTEAGDSYQGNDSINGYFVRNSVIYNSFPYLENFEAGNGGYFSGGYLDSWQYGTPASPLIHSAASGAKAWKTNLAGHYNNLEHSFLYSPCFDISALIHPRLSFSAALDIENCGGTLCDAAWMEYSFDGVAWSKLGSAGEGYNWYDSTFDIWNPEGFTRWHVATIPLPELGGGQQTRFRWVMNADPAVTHEGIAVDDVHIYDIAAPILPARDSAMSTGSYPGNAWTDDTITGGIVASLQPGNQSLGNVTVTLYEQDSLNNADASQYGFPRSYAIKPATPPGDSVAVRLYLLDSDFIAALYDTSCPSCAYLTDAYRLGVTQYDNPGNTGLENGTLADDTGGTFYYHPYSSIAWVPYDRGYYAQFSALPLSEFWFNNGGPTGTFPIATGYLSFAAYRRGSNVVTAWYSLIDTAANAYSVERSTDGVNFTDVKDTAAVHANPGVYSWTDPVTITASAMLYYRLRWTMTGKDSAWYSPIRAVSFADTAGGLISFTASMVNSEDVLLNWSSQLDGITARYRLERAINNNTFATIASVPALHAGGHQYYYTDQPGPLPTGARIHYRLTAVQEDSSTVQPPIQTVEWGNSHSIVSVYPNPTHTGAFTLLWSAPIGTQMSLVIRDLTGRSMYKAGATAQQWMNTTVIQAPRWPSGVYNVIVEIGGVQQTAKVVFE